MTNIISIILSIIICYLLHLSDLGNGEIKGADWIGLIFMFLVAFFISRWLLKKVKVTNQHDAFTSENNEFLKNVKRDLEIYNNAKNTFKYLSDHKLLEIYKSQISSSNLEMLALEETLVEKAFWIIPDYMKKCL